ncbi:hypothetical protein SOVF_149290 [Spinacia oleracea]|nr:hypothetical protein SOVF_149290 [Spinacia oleracea]
MHNPISTPSSVFTICTCVSLLLFLPQAKSLNFSFPRFDSNTPNINLENDSFVSNGVIQLTRNQQDASLSYSVGRASYSEPVRLWNNSTREVTDFTTHFSFLIRQVNNTAFGDGLAFFLAPMDSLVPDNSSGGYLGLVSAESYNHTSQNQFVAVEFDTFRNHWDPSSDDHVGIDVNSIVSEANLTWSSTMRNGSTANAWITYNSSTRNLSVFLTYADNPVFSRNSSLSLIIDLTTILPERVRVGFSASTGLYAEIHNILSWDFSSTLSDTNGTESTTRENARVRRSRRAGLIGGVSGGIGVLVAGLVLIVVMWWRRKPKVEKSDIDFDVDDHEFEKGTGPRRFTNRELCQATNNFSEEGKLGEGGFGGVYLGLLEDPSREIAVKKISRGSKQGKKEYVSEVKIISRLRHRNLVQLLGWCHEQGDLLLVYEFVPNGSLDFHLYGGKKVVLSWKTRRLLEAVDRRLEGEFEMQQVECLMVVGLWCCHPDYTIRPSIRQVINVLNSEAPLPSLPSKFPVPIYFSPPMNMDILSMSSPVFTGLSDSTNSSSRSVFSGTAPLLSHKENV